MMDITPRVNAAEYIGVIEDGWKRAIYTTDMALDMLNDARQQIAERDPEHELIATIDGIKAKINAGEQP